MRPCARTPRMRLRVESAGGQERRGFVATAHVSNWTH
jgi:hypothetical protein